MTADTLSRARAVVDGVLAHRGDIAESATMDGPRSHALAECAAALVALVHEPGWYLTTDLDGNECCWACRRPSSSSAGCVHDAACPVPRADAAIQRLASEGVTDGD